jgi:general secretion pathway protein F
VTTSFHFRAVAPDGKMRTGSISADSEKRVAAELRKQGLVPVYVGLAPQSSALNWKLPEFGGGKRKAVLYFTQEIATLLNAGIPLDRALSITGEIGGNPEFQTVNADILRILKGGKTLADSLAAHPDYFSNLYINMVRAGEASGQLHVMFDRLAEFERTREELRGYVISSMVYPALLALVGLVSIIVLLYFVVPRFAQVFEESRLKLPPTTWAMLEVSKFVRAYGPFMLAALALASVVFNSYVRTPDGRLWWDGYKLRIPVLGDALRKMETARFARAMGTLVGNAVPLVQSIGISSGIMTNKVMANSLEGVTQGVKRGEGIAGPIKRTGQFPPLAGHLLTVGEETGHLDAMFLRMAGIYDEETKSAIKRFTSLFEPLVILVMGVVVGVLIISMLMAITSINEVAI